MRGADLTPPVLQARSGEGEGLKANLNVKVNMESINSDQCIAEV